MFSINDSDNKHSAKEGEGDSTIRIVKSPAFMQTQTPKIENLLGKGEDAKTSIAWLIMRMVIYFAIGSTIVLFSIDIYNNRGKNCLEILKQTWSIFAPVITLTLGYLFGKAQGKTHNDSN